MSTKLIIDYTIYILLVQPKREHIMCFRCFCMWQAKTYCHSIIHWLRMSSFNDNNRWFLSNRIILPMAEHNSGIHLTIDKATNFNSQNKFFAVSQNFKLNTFAYMENVHFDTTTYCRENRYFKVQYVNSVVSLCNMLLSVFYTWPILNGPIWVHVKSVPKMVQLRCFTPVSEAKSFLSIDASIANRFCRPYRMHHMHITINDLLFHAIVGINICQRHSLPFLLFLFKCLCYVVTSRCKYFSCKVFIRTFIFHIKFVAKSSLTHWMNVNKTKIEFLSKGVLMLFRN